MAASSGLHDASTTLSASRTGKPDQPSDRFSRERSLCVVHGPSVVDATIAHTPSAPENGFGYKSWSLMAAVPPLAQPSAALTLPSLFAASGAPASVAFVCAFSPHPSTGIHGRTLAPASQRSTSRRL